MMTTAQVAIQMPFATQELAQAGGGYYCLLYTSRCV